MSMDIIKHALAHYRFIGASCIGLGLFLGVFVGSLLWLRRAGAVEFYQKLEKLPFEEKS